MNAARIDATFRRKTQERFRDANHVLSCLLVAQWVIAVTIGGLLTSDDHGPLEHNLQHYVKLVVLGGGAISAIPLLLIHMFPTATITRHAVAVAQMMWSCMFISMSDGQMGTPFHLFGSLAFLALYRDWKLLVTAALVVFADHLVRGSFWPDAVEYIGWVMFEDLVLIIACNRAARDLRAAAADTVDLEMGQALIQRKVAARTEALTRTKNRYRTLIESTSALPFEYSLPDWKLCYFAPQATRLLGVDVCGDGLLGAAVHPSDRETVSAFMRDAAGADLASRSCDVRLTDATGRIVYVRVFLGERIDGRIAGVVLDITKQTRIENELRQAQKLESVGRLAAGVAHEINTPVQFIGDSVTIVREAIGDLRAVIDAYEACVRIAAGGGECREQAERALQLGSDTDLPYLHHAVPEACERAAYGLGRVAEIVRSVKTFAHPEKAEMTAADINMAIERAVLMARSEYKYVADVHTALEPLPPVVCHLGEVTQAVLNLVINASHAIADRMQTDQRRGAISISTRRLGEDRIRIAVTDDGCGVPDAIRGCIFEPFVTTKEIGRGTGQGLAISRAVIERHHGTLTFDSTRGVGTTFIITLPVPDRLAIAA